ncbi:hypothetical protein [Photobacterium sanguinicancri]|uniref:hypothetical protein n=1 Tax=Photobacterium sanguinicancri TaxID=875932 RepID=UPI000787770D|nr:hypothetical protein [Photobacterium sanguinicancri]KXI21090.1 hypothetical protein AS132_20655 [Photobacterium sanguinicancri]
MRALLNHPEFSYAVLGTKNFVDFLYKDTSLELLARVLQLQEHNFALTVPWAAIIDMCYRATPEQLEVLGQFLLSSKARPEDRQSFLTASSAIIMRSIHGKVTDLKFNGFSSILETLLLKTLETDLSPKVQAEVVLALLPSPLSEEFYSDIKEFMSQQLISQAVRNLTYEYLDIVNRCLLKLNVAKSNVWAEVEKRCEDKIEG